jgi:hypothetical protein
MVSPLNPPANPIPGAIYVERATGFTWVWTGVAWLISDGAGSYASQVNTGMAILPGYYSGLSAGGTGGSNLAAIATFYGPTPPQTPTFGQTWVDTTNPDSPVSYLWVEPGRWQKVSDGVTNTFFQTTDPAAIADTGDTWYNPTNNSLRIWDGTSSTWTIVNSGSALAIADGTYQDVTVSGTGLVWTLNSNTVGADQLKPTGVIAGNYINASITVDEDGRITNAINGGAGGGAGVEATPTVSGVVKGSTQYTNTTLGQNANTVTDNRNVVIGANSGGTYPNVSQCVMVGTGILENSPSAVEGSILIGDSAGIWGQLNYAGANIIRYRGAREQVGDPQYIRNLQGYTVIGGQGQKPLNEGPQMTHFVANREGAWGMYNPPSGGYGPGSGRLGSIVITDDVDFGQNGQVLTSRGVGLPPQWSGVTGTLFYSGPPTTLQTDASYGKKPDDNRYVSVPFWLNEGGIGFEEDGEASVFPILNYYWEGKHRRVSPNVDTFYDAILFHPSGNDYSRINLIAGRTTEIDLFTQQGIRLPEDRSLYWSMIEDGAPANFVSINYEPFEDEGDGSCSLIIKDILNGTTTLFVEVPLTAVYRRDQQLQQPSANPDYKGYLLSNVANQALTRIYIKPVHMEKRRVFTFKYINGTWFPDFTEYDVTP